MFAAQGKGDGAMIVKLTRPQIMACIHALSATLHASDEDEQRTVFGSLAKANAGQRAYDELISIYWTQFGPGGHRRHAL
jgi:hypothetical protein